MCVAWIRYEIEKGPSIVSPREGAKDGPAQSGDVQGTVTYEWMEGGFFLIQHVDLGPEAKGMEVIGHERPLGASRART